MQIKISFAAAYDFNQLIHAVCSPPQPLPAPQILTPSPPCPALWGGDGSPPHRFLALPLPFPPCPPCIVGLVTGHSFLSVKCFWRCQNALIYFVCQGQDSIYPEKPSPSLFGNPLRFHHRQLLVANWSSFDKWRFYLCQLLEFPSRRFAQPPSNCTGDDIFWCHTVLQFTLCMICFVGVSCCWCTVKKN